MSSGSRVLSFNLLDGAGNKLIAASSFAQDDPATWTASLSGMSDIAAGQQLGQSAQLVESPLNAGHRLRAHSMDCHSASAATCSSLTTRTTRSSCVRSFMD
ncbi:hypothetical protein LJ656_34625 [Paraburkholderia sp. MMS20-SJTR3]|uniref:Uncharacterized protein n=1 Tax=Paraburkholderia sejongensis TaxID=2886946 RepID=A0ABS8K6X1_9BURK|nr:hypothetical protein [Paraburkholderia sp. MMS20-SJTR3]MCC8397674.1 hypothetical protein [Paraburkholderia sp. MMS20-SJTR3]